MKTSNDIVAIIGLGNFISKDASDCLSARYDAGNNNNSENAGADQ